MPAVSEWGAHDPLINSWRAPETRLSGARALLQVREGTETAPARQVSTERPRPAPPTPRSASQDFVEVVIVKMPYAAGTVSVDGHVIEVSRPVVEAERSFDPEASGGRTELASTPVVRQPASDPGKQAKTLAGGRTLPKLLVATDAKRLARNIGDVDASAALAMVRQEGTASWTPTRHP